MLHSPGQLELKKASRTAIINSNFLNWNQHVYTSTKITDISNLQGNEYKPFFKHTKIWRLKNIPLHEFKRSTKVIRIADVEAEVTCQKCTDSCLNVGYVFNCNGSVNCNSILSGDPDVITLINNQLAFENCTVACELWSSSRTIPLATMQGGRGKPWFSISASVWNTWNINISSWVSWKSQTTYYE